MPWDNLITSDNDRDEDEISTSEHERGKNRGKRSSNDKEKKKKGNGRRKASREREGEEELQDRTEKREKGKKRRAKNDLDEKQPEEDVEEQVKVKNGKVAKSKKNLKNETTRKIEQEKKEEGDAEEGKSKKKKKKEEKDRGKQTEKEEVKKKKHKKVIETSSEQETSEEDNEEEEEDEEETEVRPESLSPEELEKLKEAVDEKKKLIQGLRGKPWPMKKKLVTLRESQEFVEKYEGALGKGKGRKLYAYKVMMTKKWMKFQRDFENFKTACIPWEMKIKEIENLTHLDVQRLRSERGNTVIFYNIDSPVKPMELDQ